MRNPEEDHRINVELQRVQPSRDPFAAAMRATRMPMIITDPHHRDNPIVFVNDAFLRLTGYERHEVLGRNCRFLQGPGTNIEDVYKVRRAVEQRETIEIDLLNYRKDGTVFWNRLLLSPVFDGNELTYFFASQYDVTRERTSGLSDAQDTTERRMQQRIAELTASEERHNFTLKAGGMGTWTLEVPISRLVASTLCKNNFGYAAADTFTYEDLQNCIHPDDRDNWRQHVEQALSGSGDLHVEYRIITPQKTQRWIEVRGETRFDETGKPLLMSGISSDVTKHNEAESYRHLMTMEMRHRNQNLLAAIQSIVHYSLRSARNPALSETISARITAFGRASNILTGEIRPEGSLRIAVEETLWPFNTDHRISCTGPDLVISGQAVTAICMALHELATNAVKYGALSSEAGHIELIWSVCDTIFVMTWTETGGPLVAQPEKSCFGSMMIDKALTSAIKGSTELRFDPMGVLWTVTTGVQNLQSFANPAMTH